MSLVPLVRWTARPWAVRLFVRFERGSHLRHDEMDLRACRVSWQSWPIPKTEPEGGIPDAETGRAARLGTSVVTEHGTPYRAPRRAVTAILSPPLDRLCMMVRCG